MKVRGIYARQCERSRAAGTRSGESIVGTGGLIHDRPHLMVVPTIRVIVENDDRSAAPCGLLLQKVDQIHDEGLFIQRIRVSGVAVLESLRLQKTHSREIARLNSGEEIVEIVLVIRGTLVPDLPHRIGTSVI